MSVAASAVLLSLPALGADVSWTGAAGSSFWDVVTNWSSSARPTASDDVTIGEVPAVQIRSASGFTGAVARSIQSEAADFLLSATSLQLSAPSSFTALRQTGGVLSSTSSISVAGSSWTGGVQTGAGTTTFAAGGAHTFGGAALFADGGRVLRNEGTLSIVSGSGNWTMDLNSTPGSTASGAARIENAGTLNVAPILNRTVTVSATNGGTGDSGADAVISNSGTLNKTGAGTFVTNVHVSNSGTINVTAEPGLETFGALQLSRGATFEAASSLTGTGRVYLSGNGASPTTAKAGSSITVAYFNAFSQSTLNIEAGADFAPVLFEISQHTVNVLPGAHFAPGSLVMSSAGTLDLKTNDVALPDGSLLAGGMIRGTGTVTANDAIVRNTTHKDGGITVFTGHTQVGAGQGAAMALDGGRVMRNMGVMTFDLSSAGGNFTADLNSALFGAQAGSGRIENQGTLEWVTYLNRKLAFNAANLGAADSGASARIDNTGIIRLTGPGTVDIGVTLNNSGTIDVDNGTLNFYGGTLDQKAGGKLLGDGTMYLQYLNPAPHMLRTGSTTSVGQLLVWGDVRLQDDAVFNPAYVFVRQVQGSRIVKEGSKSMIWSDGTLDVESKITVQQDLPLVLRGGRLGGAGTVEMVNAANASTPTVVAEGGVVAPGGSLGSAAGTDFYYGTFSITGDYEQQRPAMLEIDLKFLGGATTNPLVGADKLAVSGEATLGGVLVVELGDGLNPQHMLGRQYTVLTSQRLFGTFDVLASTGNWGNFGYSVDYVDGNDVDLFADQVRITINGTPVPPPPPPVPEPGTWALMLAGAGLLVARARRR